MDGGALIEEVDAGEVVNDGAYEGSASVKKWSRRDGVILRCSSVSLRVRRSMAMAHGGRKPVAQRLVGQWFGLKTGASQSG
jgi:hypothetical protein